MRQVVVSAAFDDLKSRHMRFLEEAARLGPVQVLLWNDVVVKEMTGNDPKFTLAERKYFVDAVRFVDQVKIVEDLEHPDGLPADLAAGSDVWGVPESENNSSKQTFCEMHGLQLSVIEESDLEGFPETIPTASTGKRKVVVTGCYDWFHSGHVRFFEEVSELGELYVVVGHDKNIELLKGKGHPMFKEDMRRYMAGAIRFVHRAFVASGDGWLDAEPEIERIRPDVYAVNEDGDRLEKRDYCQAHGIEYRVLERLPKEGLPKRESTDLRGF